MGIYLSFINEYARANTLAVTPDPQENTIFLLWSKLNDLNVSRETFLDFENYISMIIEKNKKINIISQNTSSKNSIIERHIIDSAQIIDFIDLINSL